MLCCFSIFLAVTCIYSQNDLEHEAPTLQVGLDGLSFSKGTLDAQLIMEIIAEKQQELKIKAIQNVFLTKVENAGGTVYSFTNNVVKELITEKDDAIRTKKILENTVNLVFVTTYLHYYLQQLEDQQKEHFMKLAADFGYHPEGFKDSISLTSLVKPKELFKNKAYKDKEGVSFIAFLLDMASETVRHDKKLKQLGLMQISYSSTYEYMNRYKNKINYIPTDSTDIEKYKINADHVYREMSDALTKVTNYIGVYNYIVEHFSFRNDKLAVFGQKALDEKAKLKARESFESLLITSRTTVKTLIEEAISSEAISPVEKKAEITNLTNIYTYLDKVIKQQSNIKDSSVGADILYTFYQEFIPLLKKQSYNSVRYLDLITTLDTFCAQLAVVMLGNKNIRIEDGLVNNFFLLASKLYQFDKATTISEYLKLIEDIGYIFPDENIKNSLSTVVSFIKDYTVINTNNRGNEVLDFNVESFIMKLQNLKPYKHSRWQFHFTVGLNNAYFDKAVILKDGSTLTNLSYVSEKIGVKFKLKDWAFYYPRNPGETYLIDGIAYVKTGPPKEPLISNWHLLAYGSGLLYNLVNSKTNNEFDMPLAGIGTGVTFSNALDFNISVGIPIFSDKSIQDSFDYPFINVGFDIQFIEYYKRLQEKRQIKKDQKKLIEAKQVVYN